MTDGSDVGPPWFTRHYLFAATQHGAGDASADRHVDLRQPGRQRFDIVDYTPLFRAGVDESAAWVVDGDRATRRRPCPAGPTAPPRAGRTRSTGWPRSRRVRPTRAVPARPPGAARPRTAGRQRRRSVPAGRGGRAVPVLRVGASTTTATRVAGVRMPDVSVPVATHAGFNPRHPRPAGTGSCSSTSARRCRWPHDRRIAVPTIPARRSTPATPTRTTTPTGCARPPSPWSPRAICSPTTSRCACASLSAAIGPVASEHARRGRAAPVRDFADDDLPRRAGLGVPRGGVRRGDVRH